MGATEDIHTIQSLRETLATCLTDDKSPAAACAGSPEQLAQCNAQVMAVFDSAAIGADSIKGLGRNLISRACGHGIDVMLLQSLCGDVVVMATSLPAWIACTEVRKLAAARFLEVFDSMQISDE